MAITYAPVNVNPSVGPSGPAPVVMGPLKVTYTTVTIGVAGDYTTGGAVLSPKSLGLTGGVVAGITSLRTGVATTGTIGETVLDCTTPATPKLKCNTATGECAAAGVAGSVIDVMAFGY